MYWNYDIVFVLLLWSNVICAFGWYPSTPRAMVSPTTNLYPMEVSPLPSSTPGLTYTVSTGFKSGYLLLKPSTMVSPTTSLYPMEYPVSALPFSATADLPYAVSTGFKSRYLLKPSTMVSPITVTSLYSIKVSVLPSFTTGLPHTPSVDLKSIYASTLSTTISPTIASLYPMEVSALPSSTAGLTYTVSTGFKSWYPSTPSTSTMVSPITVTGTSLYSIKVSVLPSFTIGLPHTPSVDLKSIYPSTLSTTISPITVTSLYPIKVSVQQSFTVGLPHTPSVDLKSGYPSTLSTTISSTTSLHSMEVSAPPSPTAGLPYTVSTSYKSWYPSTPSTMISPSKTLHVPKVTSIAYYSPTITLHSFVTKNVSSAEKPGTFVAVCVAEGYPQPNITWQKSPNEDFHDASITEEDINLTQIKSTLVVYPIFLSSAGNYTCEAKNSHGVAIATAKLTVTDRPRIIWFYPFVRENINAGGNTSSFVVYCAAVGYPRPKITWLKFLNESFEYTSIKYAHVGRTETQSLLVVDNYTLSSAGDYSCKASNDYGTAIVNVTFIVHAEPRVTLQERKMEVEIGSSAVFTCAFFGFPKPNVTWFKDGHDLMLVVPRFRYETIENVTDVKFQWKSYLRINITKRNDSGTYHCVAKNIAGVGISTTSVLQILEPPDPLVISVTNVTEESITINWKVIFDGNSEITLFYINAYDYKIFVSVVDVRIMDGSVRNYTISNLKPGRRYMIDMTAVNSIGRSRTVSILGVTRKEHLPHIYLTLKPQVVEEGKSVMLVCKGGELQSDLVYSWIKGNKTVDFNVSRYSFFTNGSFIIDPVSIDDDGPYRCVAKKRRAYVMSDKVNLTVWYFNEMTKMQNYIIYEGENINISCAADGRPDPTVMWYYNKTRFGRSKHYMVSGVLIIKNVSIENSGSYKCVGTNPFKSVELVVSSVMVKAFPLLNISSSMVYVTKGYNFTIDCTSDDRTGLAKLVTLEWFKDDFQIDLVAQSNHFKTISLTRLLVVNASVEHSGRYQCEGQIGGLSKRSPFVDVIVFIPSGPVVLEKEPEASITGIRLSWKPIDKKYWNGDKITYKTSIYYSSEPTVLLRVITSTKSEVTIGGLKPESNYTIIVSGYTKYGGIPPAVVRMKTKPNINAKQYEISIRLTEVEFSDGLEDSSSDAYTTLGDDLETSIDRIFRESNVNLHFIKSRVTGFSKGSVIAHVMISMANGFTSNPSIVVKNLNNADRIGEYKFQKSFTKVADFNECKNRAFYSCHEYANCSNIVGSYICTCQEGFFGDGTSCTGPPQIIARSPPNVTQLVETNVTLVCTVIADPNPVITWTREQEGGVIVEVKRTSQKNDGNLNIYNAEIEESGVYICNASNQLGHESYETKLTIKPVIVDVDVEIKLANRTFEEELENKTSTEYKALEQEVYTGLFSFFNNTPGFKDIEILGFAKGSVNVLFRVIFNVKQPSKTPRHVVVIKVGRKLNKELKKGRVGNIQVVPGVIKISGPPPPPDNVIYSDIKETSVHIYWDRPELHEMFSIEYYNIAYRMYGKKEWKNQTVNAELSTNAPLKNLESDSFYSVYIIAINPYGTSDERYADEIKTLKVEVISPWLYVVPIICIAVIALIVLLVWVTRRFSRSATWNVVIKKRTIERENKKDKELYQMSDIGQHNNVYENDILLETDKKIYWKEISRSSIELQQRILDKGEFGVILVEGKVTLLPMEKPKHCAVKMLKDKAAEEIGDDLMVELYNISSISSHKNIVNIIGACTLGQESPLIVLELCDNGNLEDYLHKISEGTSTNETFMSGFSTTKKLKMALDVAEGMDHLSKHRIVHRDLAARNICLDDNYTAKVSNFGHSRDIYERGSYVKSNGSSKDIPTRWMAIESIVDGLYTTESDVWSFGVLMWEIETAASIPFGEYEETAIVDHLRRGHRLKQPKLCPDIIYQLMSMCWEANPCKRPTFEGIITTLDNLLVNEKLNPS